MKSNIKFLPFRFEKFHNDVLITNDTGNYLLLSENNFNELLNKNISDYNAYYDLKSNFFIYTDNLEKIIDVLATKYRTKHRFIYDKAYLHIFVVTLRCNQKCKYCHAASEKENIGTTYDMDLEVCKKSVDFALNSPSEVLKFEFQGGEPLLNFDAIKYIIEYSESEKIKFNKTIEYVICSNLYAISDDKLDYIKEKNIKISTSLDGPEHLHDKCRLDRNDNGTYKKIIKNIKKVQNFLGKSNVSALLTVTSYNLKFLDQIIDEYIQQGFDYIFIRNLNPYGFCLGDNKIFYSVDDFTNAYIAAFQKIINVNLQGYYLEEAFATILLTRIMTPFSTGFVDLQSPTGYGLNCLVYDYNGKIFISDEGRMLNRTFNDNAFSIGTVSDDYDKVISNIKFKKILENSVLETTPKCSWCVYKPYCGSDPINYYTAQLIESDDKIKIFFCKKNKAIFSMLFEYILKNDDKINNIFWSWIKKSHNSF